MNKLVCKECGKVVEGYGKNHTEFLMAQHNLIHRKKTTQDPSKPQNELSKDDNQLNNTGGKNDNNR